MTGQRTNREKALKVKCPICNAEPGKKCTTEMQSGWLHKEGSPGKGRTRYPHNERRNK